MQSDLTVAAAYLEGALRQIDQGLPGFPSGLDGGGASDGLNAVERLATTPDKARQLERQLFDLIGGGYDTTAHLAKLTRMLGVTPSMPKAVKGDIPDGWCENHYNVLKTFEQTRRLGGTYCRFCEGFKLEHKGVLPNRALLDVHGRKARVNDADIARCMPGLKGAAA